MTKDMTQGSPRALILGFTIPLLFGNLFQQFYSLVDSIIVGKFLGVNQLAAVGATGSINFLILGFCMGVCNGFAVPVAQRFGAKDESGLRKYVANCTWLSIIIAVLMTVLTVSLCRQILLWMKTPADIIDDSYRYIVIIFAGIPVTILYNMVSSIIRSLGDSKTPVYFLVLSALLNVVLDLFCILVLKMGVAGAAVATVISQAISGICCLVFMIKKFEILRVRRDEWKMEGRIVSSLLFMGLPMGLQYSITAIGSVVLQSAINSLGSVAVASVTAANKIGMMFNCIFDSLGATMATFAGQNLGAGKTDRIRKGLVQGVLIGFGFWILSMVIIFFFSDYIALLFVDASETQILANVRTWLLITGASYWLLVFVNNVRLTIQGLGYSTLAICAGIMEMIARAFVGAVLVPRFGFVAVCFGHTAAWIMADAFLIPAYFVVMRRIESGKALAKTAK